MCYKQGEKITEQKKIQGRKSGHSGLMRKCQKMPRNISVRSEKAQRPAFLPTQNDSANDFEEMKEKHFFEGQGEMDGSKSQQVLPYTAFRVRHAVLRTMAHLGLLSVEGQCQHNCTTFFARTYRNLPHSTVILKIDVRFMMNPTNKPLTPLVYSRDWFRRQCCSGSYAVAMREYAKGFRQRMGEIFFDLSSSLESS